MKEFASKVPYCIDIFKAPFLFRINSNEKSSTSLGGFLSIGIFTFLLIFLINSDVFHHLSPITSNQSLYLSKKERLEFNEQNFGFLAALTDDPGVPYTDPRIFTLTMTQYVLNCSNSEYLFKGEKELHPCDENDFPDNKNILDEINMSNYSCPSNKTFVVDGGWDEAMINYIYLVVKLCDNATMNNTCKSYDEMTDFLTDKYLNIYFKQASYDLNKYMNPMQIVYKNLWWSLSPKARKTIGIFFKKVEILTDDGLVFQSISLDDI